MFIRIILPLLRGHSIVFHSENYDFLPSLPPVGKKHLIDIECVFTIFFLSFLASFGREKLPAVKMTHNETKITRYHRMHVGAQAILCCGGLKCELSEREERSARRARSEFVAAIFCLKSG